MKKTIILTIIFIGSGLHVSPNKPKVDYSKSIVDLQSKLDNEITVNNELVKLIDSNIIESRLLVDTVESYKESEIDSVTTKKPGFIKRVINNIKN